MMGNARRRVRRVSMMGKARRREGVQSAQFSRLDKNRYERFLTSRKSIKIFVKNSTLSISIYVFCYLNKFSHR